MTDPLLDLIAHLPQASVSPERARRTQERCHRALQRQTRRRRARHSVKSQAWSRAVIALATLYLTAALRQALQVYSLR
jgi:hypothetical protein